MAEKATASNANQATEVINLETAALHHRAAKETLRKVTEQLDMKTVTIAQLATSLMTNAHPEAKPLAVANAVKIAREILAETQNQLATEREAADAAERATDPGR